MRPILTKEISIKEFTHFFWLNQELITFCEENNLSREGTKIEVQERIKNFLKKKIS